MFLNRGCNGNNHIGKNVAKLRKSIRISQRELADRLSNAGVIFEKNAVQRIESGKRFVTDIELIGFCKVFNVPITSLYPDEVLNKRD